MLALLDALAAIQAFVQSGGVILYVIAIMTFVMWTLLFERFLFYKGSLGKTVNTALNQWEGRAERKSWNAHQIRRGIISVPTMAGMVAAISGVFGTTFVNQIASRESQLLEDHLTMDH